jgi:nitrogen fixation protein FixH
MRGEVMKRFTKYGIAPYLFGLVAFFLCMDVLFIGVAVKTFSGVYTDNSYQKGLEFDKIHNQDIYDQKLGWKAKISFNKEFNQITLHLLDRLNFPIVGAKVQAKLMSPVTEVYDQGLFLNEVGEGVYKANFQPKVKGQLEVRIKAVAGKIEFITTERVLYKPS